MTCSTTPTKMDDLKQYLIDHPLVLPKNSAMIDLQKRMHFDISKEIEELLNGQVSKAQSKVIQQYVTMQDIKDLPTCFLRYQNYLLMTFGKQILIFDQQMSKQVIQAKENIKLVQMHQDQIVVALEDSSVAVYEKKKTWERVQQLTLYKDPKPAITQMKLIYDNGLIAITGDSAGNVIFTKFSAKPISRKLLQLSKSVQSIEVVKAKTNFTDVQHDDDTIIVTAASLLEAELVAVNLDLSGITPLINKLQCQDPNLSLASTSFTQSGTTLQCFISLGGQLHSIKADLTLNQAQNCAVSSIIPISTDGVVKIHAFDANTIILFTKDTRKTINAIDGSITETLQIQRRDRLFTISEQACETLEIENGAQFCRYAIGSLADTVKQQILVQPITTLSGIFNSAVEQSGFENTDFFNDQTKLLSNMLNDPQFLDQKLSRDIFILASFALENLWNQNGWLQNYLLAGGNNEQILHLFAITSIIFGGTFGVLEKCIMNVPLPLLKCFSQYLITALTQHQIPLKAIQFSKILDQLPVQVIDNIDQVIVQVAINAFDVTDSDEWIKLVFLRPNIIGALPNIILNTLLLQQQTQQSIDRLVNFFIQAITANISAKRGQARVFATLFRAILQAPYDNQKLLACNIYCDSSEFPSTNQIYDVRQETIENKTLINSESTCFVLSIHYMRTSLLSLYGLQPDSQQFQTIRSAIAVTLVKIITDNALICGLPFLLAWNVCDAAGQYEVLTSLISQVGPEWRQKIQLSLSNLLFRGDTAQLKLVNDSARFLVKALLISIISSEDSILNKMLLQIQGSDIGNEKLISIPTLTVSIDRLFKLTNTFFSSKSLVEINNSVQPEKLESRKLSICDIPLLKVQHILDTQTKANIKIVVYLLSVGFSQQYIAELMGDNGIALLKYDLTNNFNETVIELIKMKVVMKDILQYISAFIVDVENKNSAQLIETAKQLLETLFTKYTDKIELNQQDLQRLVVDLTKIYASDLIVINKVLRNVPQIHSELVLRMFQTTNPKKLFANVPQDQLGPVKGLVIQVLARKLDPQVIKRLLQEHKQIFCDDSVVKYLIETEPELIEYGLHILLLMQRDKQIQVELVKRFTVICRERTDLVTYFIDSCIGQFMNDMMDEYNQEQYAQILRITLETKNQAALVSLCTIYQQLMSEDELFTMFTALFQNATWAEAGPVLKLIVGQIDARADQMRNQAKMAKLDLQALAEFNVGQLRRGVLCRSKVCVCGVETVKAVELERQERIILSEGSEQKIIVSDKSNDAVYFECGHSAHYCCLKQTQKSKDAEKEILESILTAIGSTKIKDLQENDPRYIEILKKYIHKPERIKVCAECK